MAVYYNSGKTIAAVEGVIEQDGLQINLVSKYGEVLSKKENISHV